MEKENDQIPMPPKPKEGGMFIGLGLLFLLITLNVAFPIFMAIMKFLFYVIGVLLIYFGIKILIKSLKKK